MKWYVSVLKTNIRTVLILRIHPGDYKFGNRELRVNLINCPKKRITARLLEKISREGHLHFSMNTGGMKEILKLGYEIELPVPSNFTY